MRNYFKVFIIITGLLAFGIAPLFAQQNGNDHDLKYRKFRVSFIPGLGTNGIDATQYRSRYSLNILAGYNGALEGGELGGLVNINKYYARGVQLGGIANISGEETQGLQFGGILNMSGREIGGIQFAGVANYAGDDMKGIQFGGVVNYTGGELQGIQFSGVANVALYDIQGLQFAGVVNSTMHDAQGLQGAGVANIAAGNMVGLFFSGVVNSSQNFEGIEASTINVAQHMEGIQTGVINVAGKAQGIQIGVINYADDLEGVPVGLISYVKNGRKNLDIWASDGGFTNVGLKLGTHRIYNMISIGINPLLNRDVWQLGWSIGGLQEHNNYFVYNDFSIFHINEESWSDVVNNIYKYRLLYGTEIGDGMALYGGPTFNMQISREDGSNEYTWYSLYSASPKGRDFRFWVGLTAGLQIF